MRRRRATVLMGVILSTRRSAARSVRSVSPSAMAASAVLAAASTRQAASCTRHAPQPRGRRRTRRSRRPPTPRGGAFRRVDLDQDVGGAPALPAAARAIRRRFGAPCRITINATCLKAPTVRRSAASRRDRRSGLAGAIAGCRSATAWPRPPAATRPSVRGARACRESAAG